MTILVETEVAVLSELRLYPNESRRVKVRNDDSIEYAVEKRSLPYGKRLPRGCLKEITEDVTSKYSLDSSDVCSITIRKRKTRYDNVFVHRMHGSYISSTVKVEDKVVGLIIQMACIRHSLTSSSYLQLVNDFISGTQSESDMVDFKINIVLINRKMAKDC